jgi:hypothetical protein
MRVLPVILLPALPGSANGEAFKPALVE